MSVEIRGLSEVIGNLDRFQAAFYQRTVDAADEIARALETYAKNNHLWKDRSGFTTQSTRGEVAEAARDYVMVALSAGMDYDVFLELAREGKYAWLMPAMLECRPLMEQILARRLAV